MPKRKWAELHMKSVLMAAEELFESKGYEASSVDDIARSTGISKSTLYVYFKSKEQIWNTLVCRGMEELLGEAKKAAESEGSFEDRYYRLCFDIASRFEEHPVIYRGTLGKISMNMEEDICKKIYETGEEINETIAGFIRSGIAEGFVRKDIDIYPAVIMMWSSISGIVTTASDKGEYLKVRFGLSREDYLKKAFNMLLEGVR